MSRLSIRMRLLILFTALFTVAFLILFYWSLFFTEKLLVDNLRNGLVGAAESAVAMIDANMHTQVLETGVLDDEQYTYIANQLRLIRSANPKIGAIYTMVKTPDPEVLLFVVSADENPDTRAELREPYAVKPEWPIVLAFDGAIYNEEIVIDEFGAWLSGFAPITDENGNGIAIVGVDMTADDVNAIKALLRNANIVVFVILYVVMFASVWFVAFTITTPLRHITQAAHTLESGDKFEKDALHTVTKGRDELARLARVFSEMALEIQAREEKLKQQVEELKIEIDEAKKTRHVEQIVDSDYFKQLQSNAKNLRQRAKRRSEEAENPE